MKLCHNIKTTQDLCVEGRSLQAHQAGILHVLSRRQGQQSKSHLTSAFSLTASRGTLPSRHDLLMVSF